MVHSKAIAGVGRKSTDFQKLDNLPRVSLIELPHLVYPPFALQVKGLVGHRGLGLGPLLGFVKKYCDSIKQQNSATVINEPLLFVMWENNGCLDIQNLAIAPIFYLKLDKLDAVLNL